MKDARSTPGPWHWGFHGELGWCLTDKDGHVVYYTPGGSMTADPNARLIEAAPELLEALQAVLASETWHRWPYILQVRKDVYHRAKDAIKKATQP